MASKSIESSILNLAVPKSNGIPWNWLCCVSLNQNDVLLWSQTPFCGLLTNSITCLVCLLIVFRRVLEQYFGGRINRLDGSNYFEPSLNYIKCSWIVTKFVGFVGCWFFFGFVTSLFSLLVLLLLLFLPRMTVQKYRAIVDLSSHGYKHCFHTRRISIVYLLRKYVLVLLLLLPPPRTVQYVFAHLCEARKDSEEMRQTHSTFVRTTRLPISQRWSPMVCSYHDLNAASETTA